MAAIPSHAVVITASTAGTAFTVMLASPPFRNVTPEATRIASTRCLTVSSTKPDAPTSTSPSSARFPMPVTVVMAVGGFVPVKLTSMSEIFPVNLGWPSNDMTRVSEISMTGPAAPRITSCALDAVGMSVTVDLPCMTVVLNSTVPMSIAAPLRVMVRLM